MPTWPTMRMTAWSPTTSVNANPTRCAVAVRTVAGRFRSTRSAMLAPTPLDAISPAHCGCAGQIDFVAITFDVLRFDGATLTDITTFGADVLASFGLPTPFRTRSPGTDRFGHAQSVQCQQRGEGVISCARKRAS